MFRYILKIFNFVNFIVYYLKYCYNDERIAFSSPLQVVIAADLNRQPYKYANRGYRLTLIEVGQVAQNIALYCEEQGLSTCNGTDNKTRISGIYIMSGC